MKSTLKLLCQIFNNALRGFPRGNEVDGLPRGSSRHNFMKSNGGPAFLRISPPSREPCQWRLYRIDPRVVNFKFWAHALATVQRTAALIDTHSLKSCGGPQTLWNHMAGSHFCEFLHRRVSPAHAVCTELILEGLTSSSESIHWWWRGARHPR